MRRNFDEQLNHLNESLIEMGGMVERAIADANRALVEQNVALAKEVIRTDDEVDHKEKEIESMCLKIILQQQPVAGDLRQISSVLKMTTDLERIGDHATDISEITLLLANRQYRKHLEHIPQMAEITAQMVAKSIDAFVKKDLDLANEVIAMDDIVDAIFMETRQELIRHIKEHAESSDQAIDLMMAAKYFERIGDHATNVAEWVVFSLTGMHKDSRIM
ncbi:MAG: phosphate signaling complex protein PhoU [Clostridiales bacterium]|nr:phosphate signaling complex protein PhoU [Clostridiales bacterium]